MQPDRLNSAPQAMPTNMPLLRKAIQHPENAFLVVDRQLRGDRDGAGSL
ncbi:MAG: hypothetical protein MZV49_02190 [Rhodopseudomonas palustris]|nr:hypothetical protein [Rhodopseudomonas palustris]